MAFFPPFLILVVEDKCPKRVSKSPFLFLFRQLHFTRSFLRTQSASLLKRLLCVLVDASVRERFPPSSLFFLIVFDEVA